MFEHYELLEVNVNIFVVDHKVLLTLIPFVYSSAVGTCDVSTKICIIIITFYIYNSIY